MIKWLLIAAFAFLFGPILLAMAYFLIASLFAKWENVTGKDDMPWAAPDLRVSRFEKKYSSFAASGSSTDEKWAVDAGQAGLTPSVQLAREFDFLEESRSASGWDFTGSTVKAGPKSVRTRRSPYRFYWVAVNPSVLIMIPDSEMIHKDFLGLSTDPYPHEQILLTPHISSWVNYGTRLPHTPADTWYWFSSELKQPPTPIALHSSPLELDLGKGRRLTLLNKESHWQVKRR